MTTTEIRALEAKLRKTHTVVGDGGEHPYRCEACYEWGKCSSIHAADALALLVAVAEAANFYVGSLNSNRDTSAYAAVHKALAALAEAKL